MPRMPDAGGAVIDGAGPMRMGTGTFLARGMRACIRDATPAGGRSPVLPGVGPGRRRRVGIRKIGETHE